MVIVRVKLNGVDLWVFVRFLGFLEGQVKICARVCAKVSVKGFGYNSINADYILIKEC